MKKNNRKGFTIVELVIVIAVIAILAAVLIPTFSNITKKANNSAALQEARNVYTEYLAVVNAQPAEEVYVLGGDKYFEVADGKISDTPEANPPATGVLVSMDGDNVVITCTDANHDTDCATCNGKGIYTAPANP